MTTPTAPFVTEQCCVATLCYPEPTVIKRASTTPKCVMLGDKFAITYAIDVTRSSGYPTLTFIANYTVHNPTTSAVSVPITITLLDGTTVLATYDQIAEKLGGAPRSGPYITKEITVTGSFPLTTKCSGKYSLQFSVTGSSAPSCPVTCNLNIGCPPQCYCLTDVLKVTGVTYDTGHVFETGVVPGNPLMFPINVCFIDGITEKKYTYGDLYTVTSSPVTISNTAILSSTVGGSCTKIDVCNVLNVSTVIIPTITYTTPNIKCGVTVNCVPKVCMCRTATLSSPTSVEIHTNFTVDQVCETCLTFTVTDYCPGSKNFKYTVSTLANTIGSSPIPITGLQNISFDPKTTVTICTPQLVIPVGTKSLVVLVTFTSPLGTMITVGPCVSTIPAATVANVCFNECVSGGGSRTSIQYISDPNCSDDNVNIIRNIYDRLFAINPANCQRAIRLTVEDLTALDSCGLTYKVTITNPCGDNVVVSTTSSLTVGGDVNCNNPAITESFTVQSQTTKTFLPFSKPCTITTNVKDRLIDNPLPKFQYYIDK